MRNNIDFYQIDRDHSKYPFSPLLLFVFAPLNGITEYFTFFTFSFYLKLFILIPSLYLLGYLLFIQYKRESATNARRFFLQFLTSPITYCVVLFHGQIDVILLFLFFLGSKLLLTSQIRKNYIIGILLYGLSIAAKTWSIVFLPALVKYVKTIPKFLQLIGGIGLVLVSIILLYSRFVFDPKFDVVFQATFRAGGPIGIWGLSFILSFYPSLLTWLMQHNLLIFVVLFFFFQTLILRKNISFFQSCFLTILSIYIIIPNWGIQYLFWIMPFLYILKTKLNRIQINVFLTLSSVYLFLNYLNNSTEEKILVPSPFIHSVGFLLWIFITYWFIYVLRLV